LLPSIRIGPSIIEIFWELGADYTTVVDAQVNDLLLFTFIANHDVYIMSLSEYDVCNFDNDASNLGNVSPVGYSISTSEAGSSLYFGCSVGSHCDRGMKVRVDVKPL
jgi:hypothetical protein